MAPALINFDRSWRFTNSEKGLRCYALSGSGFEEIPNTTALLRESQPYKLCILHTAEQQFWEQVGVRQEYLEEVRSAWEIPSKFWEQLWAPRIAALHDSGFQYYSAALDSLADDPHQTQHVTVTLNWASFNKFQSVIAHYDIATSRLRVLLRDNGIFWGETALSFLRSHSKLLLQEPMAIIGLLLVAGHDAVLADAQGCGAAVNKMELSLGVTAEEKQLHASGYTKSGRTLKEENLVLYSIQKSVSRNLRSCDYMSAISNSYDIFAAELDRQLLHKIPLHSVRNVVHRLSHTEAYLHHLQRMLQTQSSMLHNLILQDDTKVSQQIADTSKRLSEAALTETTAMKTVAYLTLAFLPVTFVSSIFSTTIFDFQNWNSEDSFKVTSDGWWIYALSCLVATTATVSVYFYWNHHRKSSVKRSLDLEMN